jgi:hypothetical protein
LDPEPHVIISIYFSLPSTNAIQPDGFPVSGAGVGIGNPKVAKVGGLQSQDGKGEAVLGYCEPLLTQSLEPSDFPAGLKIWSKNNLLLGWTGGLIRKANLNLL